MDRNAAFAIRSNISVNSVRTITAFGVTGGSDPGAEKRTGATGTTAGVTGDPDVVTGVVATGGVTTSSGMLAGGGANVGTAAAAEAPSWGTSTGVLATDELDTTGLGTTESLGALTSACGRTTAANGAT
ncbi:MAG: hypothetical protein C0445_08145 [Polaromonas sp.]|nr:hypothetical protein [Polaromonas sp.]